MDPLSDLLRVVRLDGAYVYAVRLCKMEAHTFGRRPSHAAQSVHREAHGLVADEIFEVEEGS